MNDFQGIDNLSYLKKLQEKGYLKPHIELDNLNYIIYLQNKRKSVKTLNKREIKFLIWDFEKLKEHAFFNQFNFLIRNQINL